MAKSKKKKPVKKTTKAKSKAKKISKAKPKKSVKAKKKPAAAKKAVKKAKSVKKTPKMSSAKKTAGVTGKVTKAKPPITNAGAQDGQHPLVGQKLPRMVLKNQRSEDVSLEQITQQGKVVVYFYPKDDTPGCTAEACGFRDNLNRIQASGLSIFGVSPDDPQSHQKFAEKYSLNFDLLADADHALADQLNVWKQKNFMGRSYMGVERSTFLIKDGVIMKAWQPVRVEGHVDEVLAEAEKI